VSINLNYNVLNPNIYIERDKRIMTLIPNNAPIYLQPVENSKYHSITGRNQEVGREPIAIIGIGCRFAGGVNSPDSFWNLLKNRVDAISEVPSDRWDTRTYYDPDPTKPGKAATRWGGFVDQKIEEFDALFFGMSPREAACLDPLQRWLLEVAWEALEDGGQIPERLIGSKTGVFIGAFTLDCKILSLCESNRDLIGPHTGTGNAMTMVSNRISYAFDFRGPSMSIDTACSSSLIAVHLACQSLWDGESTLALAGGANAMFRPEYTIAESKAGMLSPDGRCKSFDARANGYVRGEGAGVVLLKPLSKALEDRDPIYALIRGTATNQDGHTNGITVPSGAAQEALMKEACRKAGVSPGQLQYVEAHGTGTPVGDPIEVNALANVLSIDRTDGDKCIIGSIKSNFGHTEAAAGVAGLIKAALCLKHKEIPANIHFQTPNPKIPFDKLCVRVAETHMPWPKSEGRALAGVNSFGFGGANAHAVLEEAPAIESLSSEDSRPKGASLIPISAKSVEALQSFAERYKEYVSNQTKNLSLEDIAYTTSLRRGHHDHRLAIVASTNDELIEKLNAYLAGDLRSGIVSGRKLKSMDSNLVTLPKLVWVFSGMGPQWWAMGRQLLEKEPIFRQAAEECDQLFIKLAGWSILQEMLSDESNSRMAETEVAQPANFVLQVGLARLWNSWGIVPDAIVGHSAGEAAAAYVASAMGLDEAVRVIYHRSRLQQRATGQGRLVAVGLSLDEAERALGGYEDKVSIAAINSPSAVTLVGDPGALEDVIAPLQEKGIFCKYLNVKVPYHSHYMNPLKEELYESLSDLQLSSSSIPLYSTVTGKLSDGVELDAEYWWKNIRFPVYFASAVDTLIEDGYTSFLELSPHPVLAGSISESLTKRGEKGTVLTSLRRHENEQELMLTSLGTLYIQGYPISWETLSSPTAKFVSLPSYPWQRERYWQESDVAEQDRLGGEIHPLLGRRLKSPNPTWEVEIGQYNFPYLVDHRIQGSVVYPGAAYVEMGLAAAKEIFGEADFSIKIEFKKALFLTEGETRRVQLVLDKEIGSFNIYSRSLDNMDLWTLHASGSVGRKQRSVGNGRSIADYIRKCSINEISREDCYMQFRKIGLEYGRLFSGIEKLWKGTKEVFAEMSVPEDLKIDLSSYNVHPAILDQCLQVLAALPSSSRANGSGTVFMPVEIESAILYQQPSSIAWIHAMLTEQKHNALKGDVTLFDEDNNVLIELKGCKAVSLDKEVKSIASKRSQDFYELGWQLQPRVVKEEVDIRQHGSWIIFADKDGVGASLRSLLNTQGENCLLVHAADNYHHDKESGDYWINPSRPEDFQRLFIEALNGSSTLRGLVHLWGAYTISAEDSTISTLEEAQTLGTNSVLHLVQKIGEMDNRRSIRLWLATRGVQHAGNRISPSSLAHAPLWGMARVIGHQEYKEFWGGIVDLDHTPTSNDASLLFNEIWQPDGEDQIAFRDGERYVARLTRSHISGASLPTRFRSDASYLITGGLGALGLVVAKWMVEQGASHLILMGRTKLPSRSTWNSLNGNKHLADQINAIRELEAMGANIHLVSVDVTNEEELQQFLNEYKNEGWPAIRGVIHSAGVVKPQLLAQLDTESFNAVMRPKLLGGWNLHRSFENSTLDHFILFSSVAAQVVFPGQGNYAAGNAFLDSLAHYRRNHGLPAISINWGPWAEVGMATELELLDFFERRGMHSITVKEGLQSLSCLIGQNKAQVTPVAADWPVVTEIGYPLGHAPQLIKDLLSSEDEKSVSTNTELNVGSENLLHALLLAEEEERISLLEEYLQNTIATVLRLDRSKLDTDQSLNTFGLDSMMAIELKNRIEQDLDVSLTVVDLLNGSSVTQIAARILPQLPELTDISEDEDLEELLLEVEQLSTPANA
jgi:acyl transferase domain-containing protein/acyl carrier protein